jgi:hypothetical protein
MAGIFISYRRADSDGWAGRLRDTLRARFGAGVFQDVDSIPDGEIFSEVIDRALQTCDVALVIIGPNWATARDNSGRRLDQEEDWVRTETAMVLNRKIRVIPVLVGGATLPRAEDLPEELRSITKRQAREIRSNSWDSDVALLVAQLKQSVGERRKRPAWLYALPILAFVAIAIGVVGRDKFFGTASTATAPAEHTVAPSGGAVPKRDGLSGAPANVAVVAPLAAPDTPKDKAVEAPRAAPEAPRAGPVTALAEAPPSSNPQKSRPPNTAEPAPRRPVAPPADHRAPQKADTARGAAPVRPPRSPAPDATETETPAAARAAPAERVARAAPLDLPNHPASSRELMVGDRWTYRLREMRFNQDLATVSHEITGGDAGGIRETVRVGDADSGGGSAQAETRRRLPLEPRIFEQQINRTATLFEFAPFIVGFSELIPGVTWTRIAGASSSDSVNEWRFNGKVTGRERIGLPAGTFLAIKAELEGQLNISAPMTRDVSNETVAAYQTYTIWFVPQLGRAVKYERRTYNRVRRPLDHEQYELISYQLK